MVTWSKPHPEAGGRELADIAREMGRRARRKRRSGCSRRAPSISTMDEADVRRILAYPHTMIGSDGLPHDAHPHPRLWGTFPRVLGHYARELGLFPLEEAVRRMTSLPARASASPTAARLRQGAFADLVLFDPRPCIDRATFEHPKSPASGIDLVLVNGAPVWRDGAATGKRPGRALRRAAAA